ncbi:hypothetical protein SO802_033417 [Lithocarpus litseifolius]|uniref:Glutamate 5-kinase n=1 Tax=Lithocarpus litseifolius TaxID=425828 RepID=A0AAW2BDI7_9ROSI
MALVIAHVGGASLWESTQDTVVKNSRSPYLKEVVSAMVNNDLLSPVNTRPLKFWKETLALLCNLDVTSARLLVTDNDFRDKAFRIQLSEIVQSLLALKVIPIFNENDVINTRRAPYEPCYHF